MKNIFIRFFHGVTSSVLILSLRQAFVALLPFMLLWTGLILALNLINAFSILKADGDVYKSLALIFDVIRTLFPLAIAISIAYYLSQNIGSNGLVCSSLVLVCFTINSGYFQSDNWAMTVDSNGTDTHAILVPILTVYIFGYLSHIKIFNIFDTNHVSVFLAKKINMILPFFVTVITVSILMKVISGVASWGLSMLIEFSGPHGTVTSYHLWNTLSHMFWLFDIHGTNIGNSIFGQDFGYIQLVSFFGIQEFRSLFVTFGGAGCVWGFVLASFFVPKNEHIKQIVRISIPFNVFNMPEILMYGVPFILNPYFIIPFLLCPIFNSFVAYYAIAWGYVPVVDVSVSWLTPALLSGYLVGGGNLITPLFQLILIALNAAIYIPFLKQYVLDNKDSVLFDKLSSRFQVENEFEGCSEKRHLADQGERLKTNLKLRRDINDIIAGEPIMYYQPKIDTQGRCYGFEALIRLKANDGRVLGPFFLEGLENAGFSDVIDWWVMDKVSEDMKIWKRYGFEPHVSINMSPSVLTNKQLINRLIGNFESYNDKVEIEILETAYIKKHILMRESIDMLKSRGIGTAIDDFGSGFSSLSLLYKLNVETIKLDKSILDNAASEKGDMLYKKLCGMCKRLGFKLVAEGVETEQQAAFVIEAGVDYLQGWVYAPALPLDEAREYALGLSQKKIA